MIKSSSLISVAGFTNFPSLLTSADLPAREVLPLSTEALVVVDYAEVLAGESPPVPSFTPLPWKAENVDALAGGAVALTNVGKPLLALEVKSVEAK